MKTTLSEELDDAQMVRLAQSDPENFRLLYEKYFKKIFLFIHHRLNDRDLTSDIASQVFLKALLNLKNYREQGVPFSAWLYRIALNECNEVFRKSSRYRFVSINHHENSLPELHEELLSEATLEHLEEGLPKILEKLSSDELSLLELRYFEQKQFREVGDILGISEANAKIRMYRLLDKMKKLFLRS